MAVMTELYSLYLSQYLQYLQYLHSLYQDQPQMEANQLPEQEGEAVIEPEEDNGAGEDLDLLDWIYLSFRGVLLLSIVYLHTSLARLLIVIGLIGLIYLYQVLGFTILDTPAYINTNSSSGILVGGMRGGMEAGEGGRDLERDRRLKWRLTTRSSLRRRSGTSRTMKMIQRVKFRTVRCFLSPTLSLCFLPAYSQMIPLSSVVNDSLKYIIYYTA